MASVNKVILVGSVGKDPEIRSTQSGKELASFSLATSESWKDKSTGERKEKTEWHKVSVLNDNLVTLVKNYVHKGSKLYIEGSLETRKWSDKDGIERFTTEVVLKAFNGSIVLLDARKQSDHEEAKQDGYAPKKQEYDNGLDDEMPF